MKRKLLGGLGALALVQIAAPTPASGAQVLLVPLCDHAGGRVVTLRLPVLPLRQPARDDGTCCAKICHIAMRKRSGDLGCCTKEDDDVA
ncbi:hypothetical protein [Novosphingobium lentum]|uniref:hypothetical protein n=1 Tax=Novosphingobium lentum TaxID=145287 RepID=UPI00082E5087|nr:hypothetical protein [Novosphingobium lentum]